MGDGSRTRLWPVQKDLQNQACSFWRWLFQSLRSVQDAVMLVSTPVASIEVVNDSSYRSQLFAMRIAICQRGMSCPVNFELNWRWKRGQNWRKCQHHGWPRQLSGCAEVSFPGLKRLKSIFSTLPGWYWKSSCMAQVRSSEWIGMERAWRWNIWITSYLVTWNCMNL